MPDRVIFPGPNSPRRRKPRPTATIDSAWLQGDVAGVEAALWEWAKPGEVVETIRILNTQPHSVTLYLEPYCEEVMLAPGQTGVVLACGPKPQPPDQLYVEYEPEQITVWSWADSLAYLLAEAHEI